MLKSRKQLASLFLIFMMMAVYYLSACTSFVYNNNKDTYLYGRNFDYPIGYCHLIINKHNMSKHSIPIINEKGFNWVSKYGSVTFNQFGREFPYGGMNEAGLVIEVLEHRDAILPDIDKRKGLTELQWVQYQLDTAGSVKDVIDSDASVRVSKPGTIVPLHYFVADKQGKVAVIEYLNGKMQVYTGQDLKYPVLSNNSYHESLAYLKRFEEFGGAEKLVKTGKSYDRFAVSCRGLNNISKAENKLLAVFEVLKEADKANTQWSTVYDMKEQSIYFKSRLNKEMRKLSLRDFDFSEKSLPVYADIDSSMVENKMVFQTHSYELNLRLLELSYTKLRKFIPKDINYQDIAKYAETIKAKK